MILDFKNRRGPWTKQDKKNSVGKFFWSEGELLVIAEVDIETDGTPCVVCDRYGNVRTAQWQKISQGRVGIDFTNGTIARALIEDAEGKYTKYIQSLCTYLGKEESASVDVNDGRYEELAAEVARMGFEIRWFQVNGKDKCSLIPA